MLQLHIFIINNNIIIYYNYKNIYWLKYPTTELVDAHAINPQSNALLVFQSNVCILLSVCNLLLIKFKHPICNKLARLRWLVHLALGRVNQKSDNFRQEILVDKGFVGGWLNGVEGDPRETGQLTDNRRRGQDS